MEMDRNDLPAISCGALDVPKDTHMEALEELPIIPKDTYIDFIPKKTDVSLQAIDNLLKLLEGLKLEGIDCIEKEAETIPNLMKPELPEGQARFFDESFNKGELASALPDELKLAAPPSPNYKDPALTPQNGPLLLEDLERQTLLVRACIDKVDDFIKGFKMSHLNKTQTELSKKAGFSKLLENLLKTWPREQRRPMSASTPNTDKEKALTKSTARSNEKGKGKINEHEQGCGGPQSASIDDHLTSTKRKRPTAADHNQHDDTEGSDICPIQKKRLSFVSSPDNKPNSRLTTAELALQPGRQSEQKVLERWADLAEIDRAIKEKGDGWNGDLEPEMEAKIREMEDAVEDLNEVVEELSDCFKELMSIMIEEDE